MDRETETVINRLMSDLKAAQDLSDYLAEKNKKLRGALQELVDWQNGPPLVTYTDGWNKAMEKASAALKENS